jgi:hypothetical protein
MSKDARRPVLAILPLVAAWLILILSAVTTLGATGSSYTTANFVVTAPTAEFAKQVGDMAEQYRDQIATDWLGKKLPRWSKPCPIRVKVGQIGAGGATTFCFDRGHVFGWNMNIQGTEERILDSVLPHEISHTILACHFRRPLPRWADEGAATLVEHESERRRQVMLLNQVLQTNEKIPLRQLLPMKDYPKDMRQVLTLYAEGYSLAEYFVQQGGKTRYLQFLEDAHTRNWDEALRTHYKINGVAALEKSWGEWVVAGMPALVSREGELLAKDDARPAADRTAADRTGADRTQRSAPGRSEIARADAARNDAARADGGRPANTLIRSQTPEDRAGDALASVGLEAPRGRSLEAPDPRARRARTEAAADTSERPAGKDRLRNDGWAEQERLPRPEPLLARIDYATADVSRFNSRTDARREPLSDERFAAPSDEVPVFDEELEPVAGSPSSGPFPNGAAAAADSSLGRRDIFDPDAPVFDETLEDSSEADSRPPDWSAFPQARTMPGATRKGSSSPFSP